MGDIHIDTPLGKQVLTGELLQRLADGLVDNKTTQYDRYRNDATGFLRDVLHAKLTPDIKRLAQSVVKYPVTIARSANATGKSFTAARLAVWFHKSFPNSKVFTAAAPPESNLKRILWGEIGTILYEYPDIFIDDKITSMHIEKTPESFITGVTIPMTGTPEQREERFSGKHSPYIFFIIDEGNSVPIEVYKGIESCMSGGFFRLLILFNPRSSSGPVSLMEQRGDANVIELSAFNHPNVITGKNIIPGAVTQEVTVDRIYKWTRPIPSEDKPNKKTSFEVPEFLVGAVAKNSRGEDYPPLEKGWRTIIEPSFYYMVLGKYPPQSENKLISTHDIANARTRWDLYVAKYGENPPIGVRPICGLDVAEFGSDSNCFAKRYGGYVPRFETWGNVDPIATGDTAIELHRTSNAKITYVDAIGVGAGVAPYMRRKGVVAVSLKVSNSPTKKIEEDQFYQMRDQLYWELREWLSDSSNEAMLPPDIKLLEELEVPTYYKDRRTQRIRISSKETMRDLLGRSPDRLESLMFTFYDKNLAQSFSDIGGVPEEMVNTWTAHL